MHVRSLVCLLCKPYRPPRWQQLTWTAHCAKAADKPEALVSCAGSSQLAAIWGLLVLWAWRLAGGYQAHVASDGFRLGMRVMLPDLDAVS